MADSLTIIKRDTVDVVAQKIREFQSRGELDLPPDYSPENAMKSAWLKLQVTVDRNSKPVLTTCTRDSIANSLLDMVVQGLTVSKDQGYFVAYGTQLSFMRSYFGTMAVTKRVTKAKEILAQVVYDGDEFAYEITRGRKRITKHAQTLNSISGAVILGAYCTIILPDDSEYSDFMTMSEIQQAWKQSKQNPSGENSTHSKFPGEMAKRTVINRTCKNLLKSSDDSSLILRAFRHTDDALDQAEVEEEISEHANKTLIDADYHEIPDDSESDPQTAVAQAPF